MRFEILFLLKIKVEQYFSSEWHILSISTNENCRKKYKNYPLVRTGPNPRWLWVLTIQLICILRSRVKMTTKISISICFSGPLFTGSRARTATPVAIVWLRIAILRLVRLLQWDRKMLQRIMQKEIHQSPEFHKLPLLNTKFVGI